MSSTSPVLECDGLLGHNDTAKYISHLLLKEVGISGLAFPDDVRLPTEPQQFFLDFFIPQTVFPELRHPELSIRCRHGGSFATRVAMPETPMHKDTNAVSGKHDVGGAGQILTVQSEPVSRSMKKTPHANFGRRVPRTYAPHQRRSCRLRQFVRHR